MKTIVLFVLVLMVLASGLQAQVTVGPEAGLLFLITLACRGKGENRRGFWYRCKHWPF
jgi:hypothetical protein